MLKFIPDYPDSIGVIGIINEIRIIAAVLPAIFISSQITPAIASFLPVLISTDLPSTSTQLAQAKSLDMIQAGLSFVLAIVIFITLWFLTKNLQSRLNPRFNRGNRDQTPKLQQPQVKNHPITSFVLLAIFLILIFNPNYLHGRFDQVEEGFWLAWMQGLLGGQTLYRDIASYHPPLIPWLLYGFEKIFGASLFNQRLFFQILAMLGSVFFFLFSQKTIKNSILRLAVLVLFAIFTQSTVIVRNNVEIRLGIALLSLTLFSSSFKNIKWLFLSGAAAALAVFTSIEIGLAVWATLSLTLLLALLKNGFCEFRRLLFFQGGFASTGALFILYLASAGSLGNFLDQQISYAQNLSGGYLNTTIYAGLGTDKWLYLPILAILIAAFLKAAQQFIQSKTITPDSQILTSLVIFSIFTLRIFLGRSDYPHLLFVLPVAILLFLMMTEAALIKISAGKNGVGWVVAVAVILFLANTHFLGDFLQKQPFFLHQTPDSIGVSPDQSRFNRDQIGVGVSLPRIGSSFLPPDQAEQIKNVTAALQKRTSGKEAIFIYPQGQEYYFFADRANATNFYTPLAFFAEKYQKQMLDQLDKNKPNTILYYPQADFFGIKVKSLSVIRNHIENLYRIEEQVGDWEIRQKIN